jgi:hypothetical protein
VKILLTIPGNHGETIADALEAHGHTIVRFVEPRPLEPVLASVSVDVVIADDATRVPADRRGVVIVEPSTTLAAIVERVNERRPHAAP